ncbi:DNA polymerase sliding clamp [Salinibaculum rarum]|uniref:DNA polymerase sliding clamp n=1 Tax=Salinibaculum rarum TaxID=3058903 RepID=UPI00265F6054|nr:DNA polymerase sliding clamp [Salinibaculum sp. KK48]
MFNAIIEPSRLEDGFAPVSALVDECKVHLEDDGIQIRAVDPANVGMVDLTLNADAFESYEADGGVLGINLNRFNDIISLFNGEGEPAHIELDDETRKLHLSCGGLEYTLALIDPDSIREEPDIPDLELSSEVVLEGKQFDRAITAADMVSDHVAFGTSEADGVFYAEAEGDTDDVNLQLSQDELIDLQAGGADSLFSVDYLKDMNGSIPGDAEVTMEVGEEFPVKIHFQTVEGDANTTFMLAPRIQSE